MNKIETGIKRVARELFAEGKIDILIGYERGTLPLRSRPCFLTAADEVDRLVWNSFCSNNLAVYLPRYYQADPHRKKGEAPPKIGIVAKGCDARSIVSLIAEKQVPRENIVIVGAPCKGMIDRVKVEKQLERGEHASAYEEDDKGTLVVTTSSGQSKKLDREQVLEDACIECRYPLPTEADILIEGEPRKTGEEKFSSVADFEALSAVERWKHFQDEMSKCVRCYACREVCPNCYCKVCFVEQTKPRWVSPGSDMTDTMLYHIGRIFHQAGRCTGCDACARACPMGIDLRIFTQKLVKDVKELFDYVPGLSFEDLPPLCTFSQEDNEDFITEP